VTLWQADFICGRSIKGLLATLGNIRTGALKQHFDLRQWVKRDHRLRLNVCAIDGAHFQAIDLLNVKYRERFQHRDFFDLITPDYSA
jgi:hypothetical protein